MNYFQCATVYLILIFNSGYSFNIVGVNNIIGVNKQILYEYVGNVTVGAQAPQDDTNNNNHHQHPTPTGWAVRGKLTLQRQNKETLAAALTIDDVILNNSGEQFLQNKEMYPPYKPFKIALTPEGTISHLLFKESDPIWSTNFKRAIASIFQFQIKSSGAFVVEENGIHGKCSTEYFISNKTDHMTIRKTPELKKCRPFNEAIHKLRSNVPTNTCKFDFQKSVIIGNEAIYEMLPHSETPYFLNSVHVKGTTLIHTFESTGEAQFIHSDLVLKFINETTVDNAFDTETGMSSTQSDFVLVGNEINDPTGGRHPPIQETLIKTSAELLNSLAEGLEKDDIRFNEPYDSTVSEIIRLLSQMDLESLQKLYTEVDIGTSYRQETIRNIFYEIIPRIGTKASVQLTKELIMVKQIKSTTAVQLLILLPFHIYELSHDLVKECESFLTLGPDRPDVRQAAILSFATLVHNVYYVGGAMSKDAFEEYVQKYYNFFISFSDYDSKMLYLQGLSNLQVGNVANYLDPIVKDETENPDIKFLAAWASMPSAADRPEKVYEVYWPIFESKKATLEMRVAALTLLLISNPTPARLISIHRIINAETCPHMINYYRTTIKSITETTFPCYSDLRRLLSYMHRHLPRKPESRYWVTGNYIFDYRDARYGIGAMLQTFLVGDSSSDLPVVAYMKFDTEALGKFTGQLALYIKARGLPDAIVGRFLSCENCQRTPGETILSKFKIIKDIMKTMKAPQVNDTPLHLEFILQMEGKTVLSYYLNQKMFSEMTFEHFFDRINLVILADSHINMQLVRWPFMTKYNVPTVLGTHADVLLQTTVLSSLRGNITQHQFINATKKTHQIDARYSSYASCKSRSYNPFLNLDHEINREQGFLVYLPINNEITPNTTDNCLKYSFHRPENLTSGLSFKSRSVTTTKGFITKSNSQKYNEVIFPEKSADVFRQYKYDCADLGVSFSLNMNLNELNKYKALLSKSEFIKNNFSKNMVVTFFMAVFGFTQLTSIHLGHDRNFTLLEHNVNSTTIDGNLCLSELNGSLDKGGGRLEVNLKHSNEIEGVDPLHEWNVAINYHTSTKTNWFKIVTDIQRQAHQEKRNWAASMDLTFAPLVISKRPHFLNGTLVFGSGTGLGVPQNASKVTLSARAGPSENVDLMMNHENYTNSCPAAILKFSPVPKTSQCSKKDFEDLTSQNKYNVYMNFTNMPESHHVWSNRIDHLISAFGEEKLDRLHLDKEVDFSLNTPQNQLWLNVDINGAKWQLFYVPFIQKFDGKFDPFEIVSYESGLKRSCSVIEHYLQTFDGTTINYKDFVPDGDTCHTLLAADCSSQPKMAVFLVNNLHNETLEYGLKVYVGENYFEFHKPNITSSSEPVYITVNGRDKINVRNEPYQYPSVNKKFEYRVQVNEQNLLIVENMLIESTIQFDMLNILNMEIYGYYKNKLCGLCSYPHNELSNYSINC